MSMTKMMNGVLDALLGCLGKKPDTKLAMAVLEMTYAKLMEITFYEEDIEAIRSAVTDAREPMRNKYLELYQTGSELADKVIALAAAIEEMDSESAVGTYALGARYAKEAFEKKKIRLEAEDLSEVDTADFGVLYDKMENDCRKIHDIDSPTAGLGERIDAAVRLADKVIALGKELEISDAGNASFYRMAVQDATDNKMIIAMKERFAI